jgi:hypothetical protein
MSGKSCPWVGFDRREKLRKCGGKATAAGRVACFDLQRGALRHWSSAMTALIAFAGIAGVVVDYRIARALALR